MKITYLYQYFVTPGMPGGSRGHEMARRLVASGHEVNLVTSVRDEGGGGGWRITDENGIKVHWYPVPYTNSMTAAQRIRAFAKFAWAASSRAASFDADIVFATSTPLTIAIPGAYASWRRKCPMVFEVRDLWPEMPIAVGALRNPVQIRMARALERFAYRRSERIVALSPGMAEGVIATGYPADRVHVIPNASDVEQFQVEPDRAARFRAAHPELGDGPIVLYAGTLGQVNGVSYLAHLAAQCCSTHPHIRFVVLGDGAESGLLKETAARLGVAGKNFFQYSRVAKEAVVDAFAAASLVTSLFVDLPEMEKNSANKFFDGLAAGRPVAINYGGWQAQLIHEHGIGLVLGHEMTQAAAMLTDFLSEPDRVSASGCAALSLAERSFSRDRLYGQLHEVLCRVAGEWRGRR